MDKEIRPKASPISALITGLLVPIVIGIINQQDSSKFIDSLFIGLLITIIIALHLFYVFGAENITFRYASIKEVSEVPSSVFIRMICWLLGGLFSLAIIEVMPWG